MTRRSIVPTLLLVATGAAACTSARISGEANAKLWAAANEAMGRFTAAGLSAVRGDVAAPYSEQDFSRLSGFAESFGRTVDEIARAKPPGTDAMVSEELLPVYRDIAKAMKDIVNASRAGARTAVVLAWQRLQLLADEASDLARLLSGASPTSEEAPPTQTPSPSASSEPSTFTAAHRYEVVARTCLNVRTEPRASAPSIGCIKRGFILPSDGRAQTVEGVVWVSVYVNAERAWGWASATYLRPIEGEVGEPVD